ncbi:hypothetical protein JT06_18850, partial [Desulfobulbus sp. Tol-SR]
QFVAVPQTLEAARVLNNLGVKVQSPIRTNYSWPGRFTPRWYQIDTSEFFTLHTRAHCHSAPRCVDKDTEFLTPAGWKKLPEYVPGDLVAQWVPETDSAEFVEPLEYIDMPCDEMIHLKTSTGVDQMLTRNHRVPYFSPSGKLLETTAEYVHVKNQAHIYGWRGKLPVTFHAPRRDGLPLSEADIRIMVMVIADGWFQNGKRRCRIRVKKERKKIRAKALLAAAGIQFSEYTKDFPTAKGFSIFTFDAPRQEKEFGEYWWDATEDQLQVIVDEVQHWDSSPRRTDAFAFSSYKRSSAEFIQYAAAATKRVASLHTLTRERRGAVEEEHVVYVRGNGTPLGVGSRNSSKAPTSTVVATPGGRCYCFSVPSTYIIFRRGGCIFISGNTGKTNAALWAADYLRKEGYVHRVLIVAPLSTLFD